VIIPLRISRKGDYSYGNVITRKRSAHLTGVATFQPKPAIRASPSRLREGYQVIGIHGWADSSIWSARNMTLDHFFPPRRKTAIAPAATAALFLHLPANLPGRQVRVLRILSKFTPKTISP